MNPLNHEIISRKIDTSTVSIAENLNWPSKSEEYKMAALED
jgi:hypothetical protein